MINFTVFFGINIIIVRNFIQSGVVKKIIVVSIAQIIIKMVRWWIIEVIEIIKWMKTVTPPDFGYRDKITMLIWDRERHF